LPLTVAAIAAILMEEKKTREKDKGKKMRKILSTIGPIILVVLISLSFTGLLGGLFTELFTGSALAEEKSEGKSEEKSEEKSQEESKEKPDEKGKAILLPEIVVSATRTETPIRQVASSVTVITRQDIEEKKEENVLDLIRAVPAVDVVNTGGMGQLSDIYMRGGKSEHTLVLIDGIEMNDPTSPGRSYNFGHLMADNIERIEVLRGPQSTLYGSDAIGGVINIITKKGRGKPSFSLVGEAGTYNTFSRQIGLSGGNEKIHYSLSALRYDTDGFSAASQKYGNTEDDGYKNTTLSAKVGVMPVSNLDLDFTLRSIHSKTDIDQDYGTIKDDPNYLTEYDQLFARTALGLCLFDGLWEQKMGLSLSRHERDLKDDKDADHPDDFSRGSYNGRILKADWQHNIHLLEDINTLTAGFDYEEESARSDWYSQSVWGTDQSAFDLKKAYQTAAYAEDQIKLADSLFASIGVRLDHHDCFGSKVTYRLAPAYIFHSTGTKVRSTFGTGFKSPSLFQLYSSYGDKNLQPETSQGWDIGLDQPFFNDRLVFGVTGFANWFKDMVGYDYDTSKYKNVSQARANGVEAEVSVKPSDPLSMQVSYTYTSTRDKSTGHDLLRRPKNKGGIDLGYAFPKKGNVHASLLYVGKRYDKGDVTLHDYTLVNLAASYDLCPNFELFGRIDNLFDRKYEEVNGYGTAGFSTFGGVKITY
jgi:vitamin B12 transporter